MRLSDNLPHRLRQPLQALIALLSDPKGNGFFVKPIAFLLAVVELFCSFAFLAPQTPAGKKLDLTGYNEVFFDDFDGDTLNTDVWYYRANGPRRIGYNSPSAVEVKDGNLVFTGSYQENGEYGPGWYTGAVALKELYRKGYFEIRCICNNDPFINYWSAFWIQGRTKSPYYPSTSQGGLESCEIDIFESMSGWRILPWTRNAVNINIHCSGADGVIPPVKEGEQEQQRIDSLKLGAYKAKDVYKSYNTYGMEWTDDEYIFYINGVEATRSSHGLGACRNPEEVIVSLEINNHPMIKTKNFQTQYIVDYVKIYQK